MNKHLMTVQEKMERVDYLLMCMQNETSLLLLANEEACLGLRDLVEGSMMTMGQLLDQASSAVKEAIEELLAEHRAEQQAAACPQGRKEGAA